MAKTGLSISKKLLSIGGICFLVTLAVVAITWGSTLATQSRVSTYAQTSTVSRDFSAMAQQFQEVRQSGFSAARGVTNEEKYLQATQDFTAQLTKLQGAPLDPQQREIVPACRIWPPSSPSTLTVPLWLVSAQRYKASWIP